MRAATALLLLLFTAGAVWAAPLVISDPAGNLYRLQVANNKITSSRSIDQGTNYAPPQLLYSSTQEILSGKAAIGPDRTYYLVIATSGESYLTRSADNGKNWSAPERLSITGEASVAVDSGKNLHLLVAAVDKKRMVNQLLYTGLSSFEPRAVFESPDKIINPRIIASAWGLALFWQTDYLDRKVSYYALSLDGGRSFGRATQFSLAGDTADIIFYGNRWLSLQGKTFQAMALPQPLAPEMVAPPNPEITYRLQTNEPSFTKIEVSWDRDFSAGRTWNFDHLNPAGSLEVTYQLPVDLPDGTYYLRLAAFNGLVTSLPSKTVKFTIDRSAPTITLISPTEEVTEEEEIIFSGQLGEPGRLCINERAVTVETTGKFSFKIKLQSGKNSFLLTATDEAGNTRTVTREITSTYSRPNLTVIKPKETDWYKPASAFYIQATINDPLVRIEDESEADITVNGRQLEDKLIYDKQTGEISGFVTLPDKLPDGKLTVAISLKDLSGKFKINIDCSAPVLLTEPVYTNLPSQLPVPVSDAGVGVDPQGTLVKITGVSLEGTVTAEPHRVVIMTRTALQDGTYEVEVTPRDLIGNTAGASKYSLVVDTSAPALTLLGTREAGTEQDKWLLQGTVADQYLATVKIYNNQKLVDSFSFDNAGSFSREVPLFAGNNTLLIEAADKAGNISRSSVRVFASLKSAGALITDHANGPNPFSPTADGQSQMYFTYQLSGATSELKIFVFDLAGTLIYKKEMRNAVSGATSWNGVSRFGRQVSNGVYPYLIYAANGDLKEIRRGKILVLQ